MSPVASTTNDQGHLGAFLTVTPQRYVMRVEQYGITFDLDRVRRERHELQGELLVRCALSGSRTIDGVLSAADFNCSGLSSRVTRAKFLKERAETDDDPDWVRLLEEFCQRVIAFDRNGAGLQWMKDLPKPDRGQDFTIHGLRLLNTMPALIFGDSGRGKSLLAVYLAGLLTYNGRRVLYADWEFSGDEHADRCERLFGTPPEGLGYLRCERPLVHEIDRIRRLVRAENFDYLVCDSIAFAAQGPPEAAEAAQGYYQALRQLPIGSLHVAHITKSSTDPADAKRQADKPFGSTFWAAGARAMWFFQSEETPTGLTLALYPKKTNTGPAGRAVGFGFDFAPDYGPITVTCTDVNETRALAAGLPIWQQMQGLLKKGAMTAAGLADELDVTSSAVLMAAKRKDRTFTRVLGADGIHRIGLLHTAQVVNSY